MIDIDISEELNKKIEDIQNRVLLGKINLLDLELVPIFKDLKDSINIYNINKYSKTYKDACGLLNQKFEELKNLLSSLDSDKKFLKYLEKNPKDKDIVDLFNACWIKTFNISALSLDFLESCKVRLCKGRSSSLIIEHLNQVEINENFLLEIPKRKFTEKMTNFFNSIQNKLPCSFEEVFEEEQEQVKIYENFVYLLHLLQLNKLKYQKETNTLYI